MVTPAVLVVATSLLTASAVFAVWAHATALRLGYELSAMDREQKQLVRDNMRLRSEVATLKSPARLEEQARSVFGLAPPAPEQIVRVGGRRGTP
jgi:cell division protein FtsL